MATREEISENRRKHVEQMRIEAKQRDEEQRKNRDRMRIRATETPEDREEKRRKARQLNRIEEEFLEAPKKPIRMPKYLFQAGKLNPSIETYWVQRLVEPRFLMVHLDYGKKPLKGMDCYRRGEPTQDGQTGYGSYCIDWIDEPPEDEFEIFEMIEEICSLVRDITNAASGYKPGELTLGEIELWSGKRIGTYGLR